MLLCNNIFKRRRKVFRFGQLSWNIYKKIAELAHPLYQLTGKKEFKWGQQEQESFDALKNVLVEPPIFALPNNKDPFILNVDASNLVQNFFKCMLGKRRLLLTAVSL